MTQPALELDMTPKSLMLVDLSALWWANWHATADQEIGEAFRRTVDKVRALSDGYDYVAVCCDAPPYKRKELSADYKAQRDKPDAAAVEQFRRVRERLEIDGYLLWGVRGYEADDVIATACRYALQDGLVVTIASGDKDLMQLVSPSVSLLSTRSGDRYDVDGVVAKWGVTPALVGDLLALMGDASDNVRGIKGCGPKTAAALIQDIGHLPDIITAAEAGDERIKPKMREAIATNATTLRVSRQLVQLYLDVPISWAELYTERKAKPLTEPIPPEALDDVSDAEFEDAPKSEPARPAPEAHAETAPGESPETKPITALACVDRTFATELEPRSTANAYKLAAILYDSRLYSQFSSPQAILAVILRGRALGLDATTSLANFHVIEGRPTMGADLIRGLVLRSGKCEYFDLVESTNERCTWVTKRRDSRREVTITWTMDDAVSAGLATRSKDGTYHGIPTRNGKPSNWDKYRRQMLRARSSVETCRASYPDLTSGLTAPEELETAE